jgi:hypothetical protein
MHSKRQFAQIRAPENAADSSTSQSKLIPASVSYLFSNIKTLIEVIIEVTDNSLYLLGEGESTQGKKPAI